MGNQSVSNVIYVSTPEGRREVRTQELAHGLTAIYIYKTPEELLAEKLGATTIKVEEIR